MGLAILWITEGKRNFLKNQEKSSKNLNLLAGSAA